MAFFLGIDVSTTATKALLIDEDGDLGTETISRHIYGHFAEHLGHDIYDGFWTKEGTGKWHLRDDVIQALRQIHIPNLRWPGGSFADYYHWKDGIGLQNQRPPLVNSLWGRRGHQLRHARIYRPSGSAGHGAGTDGDQMILTPTYHVFDLYKAHQDAILLPLTFDRGTYDHEGPSIPALSASASKNTSGTIHLTLVNLDPNQECLLHIMLRGQDVLQVTDRVLTALTMNAHNTFDQPHNVQPAAFIDPVLHPQDAVQKALPALPLCNNGYSTQTSCLDAYTDNRVFFSTFGCTAEKS